MFAKCNFKAKKKAFVFPILTLLCARHSLASGIQPDTFLSRSSHLVQWGGRPGRAHRKQFGVSLQHIQWGCDYCSWVWAGRHCEGVIQKRKADSWTMNRNLRQAEEGNSSQMKQPRTDNREIYGLLEDQKNWVDLKLCPASSDGRDEDWLGTRLEYPRAGLNLQRQGIFCSTQHYTS